jgi:hypothetical protein
MTNMKTLFLGAALALAGVCVGEGIAHADCDRGSYSAAMADVYEGEARGMNCEAIQLENGTFEAQCDEVAYPEESDVCATFVEMLDGVEDFQNAAAVYATMYEACMTIAIHTPGAVTAGDLVTWTENGITHRGTRYEFEESGPNAVAVSGY